jgi:hypothetical protein
MPEDRPLTKAETVEAVALLRRLLRAVEVGELAADDPISRSLLNHLRGAANALGVAAGLPDDPPGSPRITE